MSDSGGCEASDSTARRTADPKTQRTADPKAPRTADTGDLESARARWVELIAGYCEQGLLPGPQPELSDDAALLLAEGLLDPRTRRILAARRAAGRGIPSIDGFGALRGVREEVRWLDDLATRHTTVLAATVLQQRRAALTRRIRHLRSRIELSADHFSTGMRAIRRDRRDGTYLDLEQRAALFDALTWTPTPLGSGPSPLGRLMAGSLTATARVVDSPRSAALWSRAPGVIGSAPSPHEVARRLRHAAGVDVARFSDRYDTLRYLAGNYFDRIRQSRAWYSDWFAVQRAQLDPITELIDTAIDIEELRRLDVELTRVERVETARTAVSGAADEVGAREIGKRRTALDPVWFELVERVAASARLVDLLEDTDRHIAAAPTASAAAAMDSRIDRLIARSGQREISTDNTHYVGDQLDFGRLPPGE